MVSSPRLTYRSLGRGGTRVRVSRRSIMSSRQQLFFFEYAEISPSWCERRLHREAADVERVMLRLSKEYPGDRGIFMPLILNLLQLKPGQAFFMGVDEPHAYLRGDILEVSRTRISIARSSMGTESCS